MRGLPSSVLLLLVFVSVLYEVIVLLFSSLLRVFGWFLGPFSVVQLVQLLDAFFLVFQVLVGFFLRSRRLLWRDVDLLFLFRCQSREWSFPVCWFRRRIRILSEVFLG